MLHADAGALEAYKMTCNLLHGASRSQHKLGINSQSKEGSRSGQSWLWRFSSCCLDVVKQLGPPGNPESPFTGGFPAYLATSHHSKLASFSGMLRYGVHRTGISTNDTLTIFWAMFPPAGWERIR